jgi:hypothetical protein
METRVIQQKPSTFRPPYIASRKELSKPDEYFVDALVEFLQLHYIIFLDPSLGGSMQKVYWS